MKRFILAAGVAALAISAPAAAKPGGGHGGDHAAKAQHGGGGGAKTARGGGGGKAKARAQASRGGGGKARTAQASRGPAKARTAHASRGSAKQQRVAHAKPAHAQRMAAVERRPAKARHAERRAEVKSHGKAQARQEARVQFRDRPDDRRVALRTVDRRDIRDNVRVRNAFWTGDDDRFDRRIADRGLINGCPPGLFAKGNGCLPPGQARKLIGQRIPSVYRSSYLPRDLRDYYRDNDDYYYRYGDGYLYRVDRRNDLVSALLPMFGGGLTLGSQFPSAYSNYYMPSAYSPFYPDSRDNYYRYANGYVYGIDRDSGLIDNIVPLMAGGYGVGQLMPASYGVYNVPYQYRSYYPDSSDAYYRYAPGAIYQVDPQTNLITSVASLLSPTGFAVGQPLPPAYSTYNVPLGYRDQYYDTPDAWYRYNNGSIYQVDPTTQLITAVISALV